MPAKCCKDKWPTIPDDEPVFVIRGKDLLAAATIQSWMNFANEARVNELKMEKVQEHLDAVIAFQAAHPERCKFPD